MCGIFGYVGKDYREVSTSCGRHLRHRGPDHGGTYVDHGFCLALGHTRLSIIDLSSQAVQPMRDLARPLVIVFNGEIYNYLELRNELQEIGHAFSTQSDTEVVLKAYSAWGAACVERFRGMFAFCVYEENNRRLFLARDRFGIKPLMYSFFNGRFMFSSELKPFLDSSFFARLDRLSVHDYFQYGAVRQPRTILDGVRQLMPGHVMFVDRDLRHETRRYYDLALESARLARIERYEDAVKSVRLALETATRYHMTADVEVGAFLSGGVDSTAVAALMQRFSPRRVNTFSVGFAAQADVVDETAVAERTARDLGATHHNIIVDDAYMQSIFEGFVESLDQPSIDGINTYIVSREAAKHLKVALSGLGGDEIFAGYPHFARIVELSRQPRTTAVKLIQALQRVLPRKIVAKHEWTGLPAAQILDAMRSIHRRPRAMVRRAVSPPQGRFAHQAGLSPVQQISKAEMETYLLSTLLRDNDALSMAHSLEVRPVLLDHKLVELAFSLNDAFKIKDGRFKAVFVDAVRDIIPQEVRRREKTGFEMPFAQWMNQGLNTRCRDVCRGLAARALFTAKRLRGLQRRADRQNLKRGDWQSLIFLCWLEKNRVMY